jgi:hypothetical protein
MAATNRVELKLEHLQEIVSECTKDLLFACEGEKFNNYDYLLGVVETWMILDAATSRAAGEQPHIWHLDDFLVEMTQEGLVVTIRS